MEVEVEGAAAGVLTLASSLLGLFRRFTVALSPASVFSGTLSSFTGVDTVSAALLGGWDFFIVFVTTFSTALAFDVACVASGSGGVGEGVLGAEANLASPVACAGAKATGEGVGEGGAAGVGAAADVPASPLLGAPKCKEAQHEQFG